MGLEREGNKKMFEGKKEEGRELEGRELDGRAGAHVT